MHVGYDRRKDDVKLVRLVELEMFPKKKGSLIRVIHLLTWVTLAAMTPESEPHTRRWGTVILPSLEPTIQILNLS
jgi:hypothetical protein